MKIVECNADLHNHISNNEASMPANFNAVIDYVHKRLGDYGMLGITNTRDDERYEKFVNLPGYDRRDIKNAIYIPEKKIWVINSHEAKTKEGHMLFIGAKKGEYIESGKTILNTLDESKSKGLVAIMPHPVGALGALKSFKNLAWMKINELEELLSGFEIYNSQSSLWIPPIFPYHANTTAKEYFKDMLKSGINIGAVSFSDGHSVREIGICYTKLKMPHPDEITSNHSMNYYIKNAVRKNIQVDEKFKGKRRPARLAALKHSILSIWKIIR